jgi:putative ABC transport system ATP-binding protein
MIAVLDPPEVENADEAEFEVAVACRRLTKQFGSGNTATMALRGVDLTVHAGQLTLLVGPSGCGKTTLISIIAGLLNPTEGDVSVFGTELPKLAGRQLVDFRAQNVGFVFQQYNLLPALTAAENAAVPLIIGGATRRQGVAKAREMLDAVGLGDKADSFPAQLSGGQQQRVAIARALINSPRLLVCDEPTAALDGNAGQTVMRLIKQVAVEPGRAVIVVTHDSRIYGLEDRMIEMSDGRIVRVDDRASNGVDRRPSQPVKFNSRQEELIREPSGTVPFCGASGAKGDCPPLGGRFSDQPEIPQLVTGGAL